MKQLLPSGLLVFLFALFSQPACLPAARFQSDEASLRAALAGGGTVTFDCDGTITLANTLVITNDTTVDASGHTIIHQWQQCSEGVHCHQPGQPSAHQFDGDGRLGDRDGRRASRSGRHRRVAACWLRGAH